MMKRLVLGASCLTTLVVLLCLAASSVLAQTSESAVTIAGNLDSLKNAAQTALDNSQAEELDIFAPKSYRRAKDSFAEALRLLDTGRESDLAAIKLRLSLDALTDARRAAAGIRKVYGPLLLERRQARSSGADTLAFDAWRRAEDQFRENLRQYERDPASVTASGMEDIAGTYRAARREALRTQLLGDARARLREVEQRGGDKIVPTLLLRIHQAISRAEAQLAQENIESARLNADEALAWADHARAMILYIEQAQKAKTPWEAALLPYDDMLLVIASYLDGTLDLSEGGSASGPQLIALIDAQSDSLKTVIAAQDSLHAALEDSIEVLQSLLTEVQNRIADLEGGSADSDSGGTSISPDELARRITRAQEAFKPGEAIVVQNPDGTVVIRLTDLQFATGATKLNKIHQRILERAIVAIAQFKNAKVRVEGHTDNSGGADINEMLSNSRAQQVADFIAKRMRLPDEQIESVGLGETQPIASNETADGRARNRRIDIVLTLP